MTVDRFEEVLREASRSYRLPPEPPLDAMWRDVEARAFPAVRRSGRRTPTWALLVGAVAAALLAGVGLGRLTTRPATAVVAAGEGVGRAPVNDTYERTASEFLGRTAVLLTALPAEGRSVASDARFSAQAGELLMTTRLLLDSPAAQDRRFKELLDDLELVLVQVARIREGRTPEEIRLITDALEERDVVPRIRTAVAQLSRGDD